MSEEKKFKSTRDYWAERMAKNYPNAEPGKKKIKPLKVASKKPKNKSISLDELKNLN